MKKLINIFKDKYFIIYSTLFLIISLIIFSEFIIGDKILIFTDIGSDTYNAYWPFYKFIMQSIKEGTFNIWSFNMGIGTSIFSITALLFDPFNIILLFFPVNAIPYGILVAMIVKLYVSGVIFYLYLNMIRINKNVTVLGSLIWAFNGYIVLWGQHYMFATEVVLFTLITFGLEMLLRNNKKSIFIIGMSLLLINSPYMAYAVSIYIFIYSMIRFLYFNRFKLNEFMKYISKLAITYLTSIGISAVVFLPSCYLLLNSPRVSGVNRSLPHLLQDKFNLSSTLTRLFSNNLMGTTKYWGTGNYYEAIILSSAILMIFLVPQLIVLNKEKRKRNVIMLTIALVMLSIVSPAISYVFNGFSAVAYRWSYLIIFAIVLGGILALNKIINNKKININILLGTMMILIVILGISILNVLLNTSKKVDSKDIYKILEQCIVIIFIIVSNYFILVSYIKERKPQYIYLLFAITLLDLTSNSYIALNMRVTLNKSYISNNQGYYDNSNEIIKSISQLDNDFYRVDKEYRSVQLNDSLFQKYYGITAYNSLNSAGYIQFSRQFDNVLRNVNQMGNFNGDKRLRSFLGVKYVFDKGDKLSNEYSYVNTFDDVNIYENKDAFPLGFTYDNYILDKDFENLSIGKKSETILNSVVVDKDVDYLSKYEVVDDKKIEDSNITFENLTINKNEKNLISYTPTTSDPNILISLSKSCTSDILLEFELKSDIDMTGQIFYSTSDKFSEDRSFKFDITTKKQKYSLPIDCKNVKNIRIDIGNVNKKVNLQNIQMYERQDIDKSLLNKDIFNIKYFSESKIDGEISNDKKKILIWTIPYCKGWKVEVDGKKVNTLSVNNGLLGIELEPGKHNIELSYVPPGIVTGGIISIITLILLSIKNIVKLFYRTTNTKDSKDLS